MHYLTVDSGLHAKQNMAMDNQVYDISLLYVEDDADTRKNVSRMLAMFVSKLYVASDGLAGLDMFRDHAPELVVTDIMMPGKNGLEMARDIRQLSPGCQIIVMTAFNESEHLLECINIGINQFIQKPVNFEKLIQVIGRCSDIIQLKRDLRQREDSIYLLSQALEQAPTPVLMTAINGSIEYANAAFTRMTGYHPDEIIGKNHGFLTSASTPNEHFAGIWQTITAGNDWEGELLNRRKNGQTYWEWVKICPLRNADGEIISILKICQDITDRKKYEENLRYLSTHDQLTGLYNRLFFDEEMKRIASSRDFPVSIVIADINGLKQINDAGGHEKGDQAIRMAAQSIMAAFRVGDVVARIGGDEFAVLLPKTDEETARNVVQRIKCVHSNDSGDLTGTYSHLLSLGVATAYSVSELNSALKEADARMYQDKNAAKKSRLPLPSIVTDALS